MEKKRLSLAQIQEVPRGSLILLIGPPGAGKSNFCYQIVLNGLAMDKPVIFVTTEHGPTEVISLLREKGMGDLVPAALSFIDAFGETVGVTSPERPDTVDANCEDLNSISMAITKLQQKIGRRDILLSFDSLTSPYLFNKEEVFRFIRLSLAKFAAEGNSVVALMDEGCGKKEDLGAMMSVADGILRMEIKEGSRIINVVKHPRVKPKRIEIPITQSPAITYHFHKEMVKQHMQRREVRTEIGDYVNLFWPNFARWTAMLLDPKRFPTMIYNLNKQMLRSEIREVMRFYPWHMRLLSKLFLPKKLSKVQDMKKLTSWMQRALKGDRSGVYEYLETASKVDEHYMKVHDSDTCWGLENVGVSLGLMDGGRSVGALIGLERGDRDWNTVETKCIGLGDPYCEFKLVPGRIDGLRNSLEAIDNTTLERIRSRLLERLMGFIIHGKPLWERPRLGSEISLHEFAHIMVLPAMASEKYRMAMRIGGATGGKEIGERLMDAGIREDEAVKCIFNFLEYCKVGKPSMDETIKIAQNCESFMVSSEEPSCFFTTGFLNGFFSAVKNQHVREIKCIAAGDQFCEWEIV